MNKKVNMTHKGEKFLAVYFFTDGSPDFTELLGVLHPGIDTTYDIAERELASMDTLWGRVDLYRVPTSLQGIEDDKIGVEHCGDCIASASR